MEKAKEATAEASKKSEAAKDLASLSTDKANKATKDSH